MWITTLFVEIDELFLEWVESDERKNFEPLCTVGVISFERQRVNTRIMYNMPQKLEH